MSGDRQVTERFAAPEGPGRDDYLALIADLLDGFLEAARPEGSGADLPGWPSGNGRRADRMEAFSRLAPALAAVLAGHGGEGPPLPGHGADAVRAVLVRGIAAGTDPASPGYWGPLQDGGQELCEASDIALTLWLGRDWLPDALGAEAGSRLAEWLAGGIGAPVKDSNWHLFPATLAAVLTRLGWGDHAADADLRLARIALFRAGGGLYRDGPDGPADSYSAWGFAYNLGFLQYVLGADAPGWIAEDRHAAAPAWAHMAAPEGWPVFGRSIHYRMGLSAPLSIGAMLGDPALAPGLARRAADALWSHFIARGALSGGRLTQGYWGDDPDLVEGYSGPASPLWSLRSLIPLLALPEDHAVWAAPPVPLPVEQDDYEVPFGETGWRIAGERATGRVTLLTTNEGPDRPFRRPGPLEKLKARFRGKLYRPDNDAARYGRTRYVSDRPFFLD